MPKVRVHGGGVRRITLELSFERAFQSYFTRFRLSYNPCPLYIVYSSLLSTPGEQCV